MYPRGLELDIYYPALGLAFEVQGVQHRRRVPHFQRSEGEFAAQLRRDADKRELCLDAWVALEEVWFDEDPAVVVPRKLRLLGLIP